MSVPGPSDGTEAVSADILTFGPGHSVTRSVHVMVSWRVNCTKLDKFRRKKPNAGN